MRWFSVSQERVLQGAIAIPTYRAVAPRALAVVRARAVMRFGVILFALLVFCAPFLFLPARVTLSCTRKESSMRGSFVTCHATLADRWTRVTRETDLGDARATDVRVEGRTLFVGPTQVLSADLPSDDLGRMADSVRNVARGIQSHALEHAGGSVLDMKLVVGCHALALIIALASVRRRRVVVDGDALRVETCVGFLPWTTRRVRIRPGDRAIVHDGCVVLDGRHGRSQLLEARGDEGETLAERIDAAISDSAIPEARSSGAIRA